MQNYREADLLEEIDLVKAGRASTAPAFRRLRAYRGAVQEVGWIALNMAAWPLTLVDEAVRTGAGKIRKEPELPTRLKPAKEAAEVPILLVHGYFQNRGGLLFMQRSLKKQGFKNVHMFSYNPVRKSIPEMANCLSLRVEQVMARTGAKQIHLVGHSLGGLICRYYVEQMSCSKKVHTLVTVATPHNGTVMAYGGRSPAARQMRPDSEFIKTMKNSRKPRSIRYISYYSNLDAIVLPGRSAILSNGNGSNVRNILVHDMGHLSLLISPELIASVGSTLSEF